MISRKAIKENAKFQLGGNIFSNNWLMGVVVMLIVGAIMSFLAPSGVGTIIVTGPLVVGSAFVFMNLLRTGNSIKIEDVFSRLKYESGVHRVQRGRVQKRLYRMFRKKCDLIPFDRHFHFPLVYASYNPRYRCRIFIFNGAVYRKRPSRI